MTLVAAAAQMFENRLRKNVRHRRRWAQRQGLTAYRLYDRDLPELPYALDWYDGRLHLVEYPRRSTPPEAREAIAQVAMRVLEVPAERVFSKTHLPKAWGRAQYERVGEGSEMFTVEEQGLTFWVNLGDYLDTGLFLDHRVTRAKVREEARGRRFLNLFAYTGSFTVYAADGEAASTTTVDLSNTYCDWAAENLALNGFDGERHEICRADVLRWLEEESRSTRRYDLVVLDPPSFSTSKKMSGRFDVQQDHPALLALTLSLLSPAGVLYFSTNYQGFELGRVKASEVRELTPATIPEDFQPRTAHRCWRLLK